jgi:hydrogenase/urease accessory protein HupE
MKLHRMNKSLFSIVLTLVASFFALNAKAHELTIAELEIRQFSQSGFQWQWVATSVKAASGSLSVVWPDRCRAEENQVNCGEDGLKGELTVDGVGKSYSAAIVRVHWLDGKLVTHTLTTAQPSIQLFGSSVDNRGMFEIGRAYLLLGIDHILRGYDHLLFVAGLLFLVGFRKKLIWTITAFTLAHSLTLVSASLGWITLRSPPVEAAIALSIVLVAYEALGNRETLSKRFPALVAFIFGLVHGLGFAGAIEEIGLPEQHVVAALLSFNVGVEIGQLFAVGAAWLLLTLTTKPNWVLRLRVPALYLIGSFAMYWMIERTTAIIS